MGNNYVYSMMAIIELSPLLKMAHKNNTLIYFAICLIIRIQRTYSGRYFIATTSAEKTPCDFDINKCKAGNCRQTETINGRNFLCACPIKKTGILCEEETRDCRKCDTKAECTGLDDGTTFCICMKYKDTDIYSIPQKPSICYFHKKKDEFEQHRCRQGKHECTPGQECVNYGDIICQCPIGNTRGANCEQDYKGDVPGDIYPCVDTIHGPLCICKKYGQSNDVYGFCKGLVMIETLVDALNDTGPCSFDRNKCRHGSCILTDDNSFTCTCANSYTGKYCHIQRPLCDDCEPNQRTECLGLPDGTAFCICNEYKELYIKTPSVCQFRKFRKTRQKSCNKGDHGCQRGEQCVNYSYKGPVMEVCQCTAGVSRGRNCLRGYEFVDENDVKSGKYECLNSENRGPVCVCDKYYDQPLGFCTLKTHSYGAAASLSGAITGDAASGTSAPGPCDGENNRCEGDGICMEAEKHKHWNYICACKVGYQGEHCHYEMLRCERCKPKELSECIGLPDNSAYCICQMMKNPRKDGLHPQICYTKPAKKNRQGICKGRKNKCDSEQQCVNYGQDEHRTMVVCQCPAGGGRDKQCSEEYALTDAGKGTCVDTGTAGPVCLCFNYPPAFKYAFCKPKLITTNSKQTPAGKESKRDLKEVLLRSSLGSCKSHEKLCKIGMCIETMEINGWNYLCSCPVGSTGSLCQEDMQSCDKCDEAALRDCIGLPDHSVICVCAKFNTVKLAVDPTICFYKKSFWDHLSKCQPGQCQGGQNCIIHTSRVDNRIICYCPPGMKRGQHCDEDYELDTPGGKWPCVDIGKYGTLCVCGKYGSGIDMFGFCRPKSNA